MTEMKLMCPVSSSALLVSGSAGGARKPIKRNHLPPNDTHRRTLSIGIRHGLNFLYCAQFD